MSKLMELPTFLERRRQAEYFDDFFWYVTAHEWTTVASDSGTIAVGDTTNGILTISPSDGTVADNDETYLKFTNETQLLAAGKAFVCESLIKFTEANTDDANHMFGVMNAVAADTILDNGAGPKASFTGAVFYKVDGGTVWRCRSSIGTTYTDTITNVSSTNTGYQRLRIEFKPNGSLLEVTYFIDGAQVLDTSSGRPGLRLAHTIDPASATEAQVFAGSKNGSNSNHETLLVDYIGFGGLR